MNLAPGKKLAKRYQIISQLGQGGFGQTFLAEDQYLPGNQKCVVKQLKPQATDQFTLDTARRLFDTEAQILYKLGTHEQIPQLFAYFEENKEFYLVQEYIQGHNLSQELNDSEENSKKSELEVIDLLLEILQILEFVHQNQVIHRDVNPNNIIRRQQDNKLILIDFGAVKQVSTQIFQNGNTNYTIAIGTPGYRPSEQANGHPKLSSDIYAVGMIGIQALTGCLPHQLPTNHHTGEINWHDLVKVSPELTKILDTMVRYDFRERYSSATECLQALQGLKTNTTVTKFIGKANQNSILLANTNNFISSIIKVIIALGLVGLTSISGLLIYYFMRSANATDLYNQGNTLYQLQRYQQALDLYQQALEIKADYSNAWKGKGDSLYSLKQNESALEAYEKAIQIQPNYAEAWMGRATVLESLSRNQEAIEAWQQAISYQPNLAAAWLGLGNLQMRLNEYAESVNSLEKATKLQPNNPESWYQLGLVFHQLKKYEQAVNSYDKTIAINNYSAQAWYHRGNSLMMLEKYQEAADSYQKSGQFEAGFAQGWYSCGMAFNHVNQYQQAINCYEQAIQAKANHYQAWYQKGLSFHQLKNYPEAIKAYNQAINFKQNYSPAWYSKGNAFYNLGEYNQAISAYSQAVKFKPDYYQAWNSYGNTLLILKKYSEAINVYNQALHYQPDYSEANKGKEQAKRLLELQKNSQQQDKKEPKKQD